MKTLNTTLQFRCEKTLIKRLKAIAEIKGEKHLTLARDRLERWIGEEERKVENKRRLEGLKKAA